MDISKLTDDTLLKKKEKNIQQYIELLGDQKFFERMRADGNAAPKDKNQANNRNGGNPFPEDSKAYQSFYHSSKFGKSKSVSLRDPKKDEPVAVSEDFGNDSAALSKVSRSGPQEIPHNDSKGREEFNFITNTQISQLSETKADRVKQFKKTDIKPREIMMKKKTVDETKSEILIQDIGKRSSSYQRDRVADVYSRSREKVPEKSSDSRIKSSEKERTFPLVADTTFQAKLPEKISSRQNGETKLPPVVASNKRSEKDQSQEPKREERPASQIRQSASRMIPLEVSIKESKE